MASREDLREWVIEALKSNNGRASRRKSAILSQNRERSLLEVLS